MKTKTIVLTLLLSFSAWIDGASQQVLTLQQCRDSAIANNTGLKIARQQIAVAGHDRKIALSNYFPDISVSGSWMYNSRDINLLSQETSEALSGLGSSVQESLKGGLGDMLSNPALGQIIQNNPELLQLIGSMSSIDISAPLNAIGSEISRSLELDTQNIFLGAVSVKQPVFTGGKIVAANKIAALAEELAESRYETEYDKVITETDNAYWQIVSIAGKKKLAQDYADLLEQMLHDTEILEAEGMATRADLLSVKVRANEAGMMLTKATNGLALGKMLLCRLCGMDMDSDIELADENPCGPFMQVSGPEKTFEDIFSSRPEIRSLELAGEIYDRKVTVARADMLPQVALTANYLLSNPNVYHGFRNDFAGMFNVGVAVSIPIIHGCESWQKVRKARAEAVIADYRLLDAREQITLQVTQLRKQESEAREKLDMAESNLSSAEENLRAATAGYTEGIVPSGTVLAAQSAWMKAHSEYIDAGVELRMTAGALAAAEGR